MKFEIGDIVRIGKGKVDYSFQGIATNGHRAGKAVVESLTTGRITSVEEDRLVAVPAAVEETPDGQHVPGETPAEYKARTGKKLDGRITSYGRAILLALQPKLHLQGAKRPRRSKIMARKPQSK